jgi:FkbM family methyltransferase
MSIIKKLIPFKFKRKIKEHLGVPSLHWSLENLKRKNFNPAVIIDIGAYEGLWTKDVLQVYPKARFLMIEAQKNKEEILKSFAKENKGTAYAISLLSSEDGATKFFEESETASHVTTNTFQAANTYAISTKTLDVLLRDINFPLPDFLKLDVQGHELEVLKGAVNALAHAEVCLLEVSFLNLGDDPPLLNEVVSFMDNRNFQAYDISHFIRRPFDKALFQIDMFFVKKNSSLVMDTRW